MTLFNLHQLLGPLLIFVLITLWLSFHSFSLIFYPLKSYSPLISSLLRTSIYTHICHRSFPQHKTFCTSLYLIKKKNHIGLSLIFLLNLALSFLCGLMKIEKYPFVHRALVSVEAASMI